MNFYFNEHANRPMAIVCSVALIWLPLEIDSVKVTGTVSVESVIKLFQ